MMLKEVGATSLIGKVNNALLAPDWYQQLNERQLAAYVRYQYIRLKEGVIDWNAPAHTGKRLKWDGGKDQFGAKHKPVWPRACATISGYMRANASNSFACSPGAWVTARFSDVAESIVSEGYKKPAPPTRPTSLYDVNAINIFEKYAERFSSVFVSAVRVTAQLLDTRLLEMRAHPVSDDARHFYVLCDHGYISATPFLRYGFSVVLQCKRAMLRYEWPAALDYEAQQGLYDAALAESKTENFISPELRNFVLNIRQHWVNYHD